MEASKNLFVCDWKTAESHFRTDRAVLVGVGSVEEHGPHLPMGTDTIIAEAVMEQLARKFSLLYYPCITFGQVWSAKDYPGTVSIAPDVLEAYLVEVLNSLEHHGVKKIICYSFHNGNASVIQNAIRKMQDTHGQENIYWVHDKKLAQHVQEITDTEPWENKIWHAGEIETSLMQYLRPELVHMELAPTSFPAKPQDYEYHSVRWKTFNETGVFGDAASGSAGKGEKIFARLILELEKQVQEIIKDE